MRLVALTSVAVLMGAGAVLFNDPLLIASSGAFAIGWSHLAGRCGQSHFGALSPKGARRVLRRQWIRSVSVYVVAGVATSAAVGAILGGLGGRLAPGLRSVLLGLSLLVALIAAASAVGWINWRVRGPLRQTRSEWAVLKWPLPELLWGSILGLTGFTVFTFWGAWIVVLGPIVFGNVGSGVIVMASHWMGRCLPIVAGPLLLRSASDTERVLDCIDSRFRLFSGVNAFGALLMAYALVLFARMGIW